MINKHTISVWVNDQPGVLQRISGLFGRRGYNIDSITVGNSEEPGLSRMIIVTRGDEQTVDQIEKQVSKLLDVIKVDHLCPEEMVSRELCFIKVRVEPSKRPEILGLVNTFRASVIDIGPSTVIVQAVGDLNKIQAMVELLKPYGILELTRTGATAMRREEKGE
jgi:acetolactate synthase-1/3 small subunit